MAAGVRAILGPAVGDAGLVPRRRDGTECLEPAPRARSLHADVTYGVRYVWNGNENLERVFKVNG